MRTTLCLCVVLCLVFTAATAQTPQPKVLAGVKIVQVDPTVVSNKDKVKEEQAPNQVADSLRKALRGADFEVGESPVRAHIVLDEFTSGSAAKRFLVGMGAGRSTIECHLVFQDASGKELFNKRIRVRGALAFSPYQGNNTQRRQAVNSLEQLFIENIETLK